jgi:hypothetical protein
MMGDGRIVKSIGIAWNLEVLISEKHIPTNFFIVDAYYDKNDCVILGRPFLKLVNAVLDAKKRKSNYWSWLAMEKVTNNELDGELAEAT